MHERLNQWEFVWAALSIGVVGTLVMVVWSLWAMMRAERRRDAVRRK
jgi:lipopolysaccharide export LptBFGC system permease protein LptF